jgi:hypothetical protein
MFARVATFEGGDLERIRDLNNERQAQGLTPPEGVRRVLVLQGDEQRLFVTFFDSREAIAAAEPGFESMGDEIPEDVRGRRLSVDVYEVVYDGEP